MTIEEAIAHCYDVANGKDNQCDEAGRSIYNLQNGLKNLEH